MLLRFLPEFYEKTTTRREVSGSPMGSLAKGSLRKVCGNSAETSREFAENRFYCVRKGCGNSADISRKFADIFLQ